MSLSRPEVKELVENSFHFGFVKLPITCQAQEFFVFRTVGHLLIVAALFAKIVSYQKNVLGIETELVVYTLEAQF